MSATTKAIRANEYETIFVLRPDVDPGAAEKLQTRLTDIIAREKGTLVAKRVTLETTRSGAPVAGAIDGTAKALREAASWVGAEQVSDLAARGLDRCLGFPAPRVAARGGVTKMRAQPGNHGVHHPLVAGVGGAVVQVNREMGSRVHGGCRKRESEKWVVSGFVERAGQTA